MFFPYLRARQYELLALKELAQEKLINAKVIPVIEPIKRSTTFDNTIEAFYRAKLPLAVIFNPAVGELCGAKTNAILPYITDNIIPAILLQKACDVTISDLLGRGIHLGKLLTILEDPDSLDAYKEIFAAIPPLFTLFRDERIFRRAVPSGKILFEDKFKKQDKNAYYLRNEDEFYSDDHLYYKSEGYGGFGDYSIIGNRYDDKGFAPTAVVIHIVYFASDNSIRIHHFVSDSNDGIEDVAGKFYEAVQKLSTWFYQKNDERLRTKAMTTLLEYAHSGYYPGLPTIKKLSIMHHLEMISKYLDGVDKK